MSDEAAPYQSRTERAAAFGDDYPDERHRLRHSGTSKENQSTAVDNPLYPRPKIESSYAIWIPGADTDNAKGNVERGSRLVKRHPVRRIFVYVPSERGMRSDFSLPILNAPLTRVVGYHAVPCFGCMLSYCLRPIKLKEKAGIS